MAFCLARLGDRGDSVGRRVLLSVPAVGVAYRNPPRGRRAFSEVCATVYRVGKDPSRPVVGHRFVEHGFHDFSLRCKDAQIA
jgi:hypothetical protein